MSRLSDEGRGRSLRWCPSFLITAVLHAAIDLEAPLLNVGVGIAKAAEWNADFDLESIVRDMSTRLPNEIRAQIILARHDVRAGNEASDLALRAVGLNAKWIDDEDERAISLAEGVEMDLDVVVR
jgi:hypothetical protein